jgi:class 3 adenylate cyclase
MDRKAGPVVAFTGHMLDRPGRTVPRFPAELEGWAAQRIAEELDRLGASIGFGSAACGSDLLFHEAILARGGETNVELPCAIDEFIEASVTIAGGDWLGRFHSVLERAESVEILGEQCAADNSMAFECCNRVVFGLAQMRAETLKVRPILLGLWDGRPGDALGGTHSMVEFCRARGHLTRIIELRSPDRPTDSYDLNSGPRAPADALNSANSPQQICSMVFADAVNFSKLKERHLPAFARHFLGGVTNLLLRRPEFPLTRNTWGDGLYIAFSTCRDAGLFALELKELVAATDWAARDLPSDFNIRIAVHAGPVYKVFDSVVGQWTFIGSHVTKAARIEPITPPGEVYGSRTFAALAAAEAVSEFCCEEVGRIELAKGFGKLPAFRVERAGA